MISCRNTPRSVKMVIYRSDKDLYQGFFIWYWLVPIIEILTVSVPVHQLVPFVLELTPWLWNEKPIFVFVAQLFAELAVQLLPSQDWELLWHPLISKQQALFKNPIRTISNTTIISYHFIKVALNTSSLAAKSRLCTPTSRL